MKKILRLVLSGVLLAMSLVLFTACDGANSAVWRMSVNVRESVQGNEGFSISVQSASGRRNRTFELDASQLQSIRIDSASESGEIILVISNNGNEDGSEITLDISNFDGEVDASQLSAGRIRFSLRYDEIRNSQTTISWR